MIKAEISEDDVTIPFMELIQHYNARIRPSESGVKESALYNNIEVDNCIVRSDDYSAASFLRSASCCYSPWPILLQTAFVQSFDHSFPDTCIHAPNKL